MASVLYILVRYTLPEPAVNAPVSPKKLLVRAKTTTVFTSGHSQAVRLPKEFRLRSKTVEISRRGDEIVLRERKRTLAGLLADLPSLTTEDAAQWDESMKILRAERVPVEQRDFSWMNTTPDSVRTRSKTPPGPLRIKAKGRVRG